MSLLSTIIKRVATTTILSLLVFSKMHKPSPKIPIGLLITNYIFSRFLLVNYESKYLIHFTSTIRAANKVFLSESAQLSLAINGNCYLQGMSGIIMEDGVIFASGCKFISANHDIHDITKHTVTNPIVIHSNTWVGTNAIILPGVEIGPNAVVGAGSVVTKSIPPNCIVAGNPARVLRHTNLAEVSAINSSCQTFNVTDSNCEGTA